MKLTLNKEYFHRHLFVAVLMLAMSGWFAYDGLIGYPRMSATELYVKIENVKQEKFEQDVKEGKITKESLDKFKLKRIHTQYGLALATLLASIIVGINLFKSMRFTFEYDEMLNIETNGKKYSKDDIAEVDRTHWKKKKIAVLKMKNGDKVTLDAWHHNGVIELETRI